MFLDQLKQDYAVTLSSVTQSTRQQIARNVCQIKAELAESFYEVMLSHKEASQYLDNQVVQTRLKGSLQTWLTKLFDPNVGEEDLDNTIQAQLHIGEVHGRINIPVHLVSRGGRVLKQEYLNRHSPSIEDFNFFSQLIDTALEIMSIAYHKNSERNSREEEAYRLFSITQNIGREKEFQRAALLDWENELLYSYAEADGKNKVMRITQSEFGLWFRHKGLHAFEGAPECNQVLEQMENIDNNLLPTLEGDERPTIEHIRELRAALKNVLYCVDSLFQRSEELEAGKDVLTRLLNRKFLPAVMSKQLEMARRRGEKYAALIIDVDHFKKINDTYGHDNGDRVLQQLAVLLTNTTRSGDYTFRLGGEEFMVLLVDVDEKRAQMLAEKIRAAVFKESFQLLDGQTIDVTVSIGISVYSGHPDYQYDLTRADEALFKAKQSGRNRAVLATGS